MDDALARQTFGPLAHGADGHDLLRPPMTSDMGAAGSDIDLLDRWTSGRSGIATLSGKLGAGKTVTSILWARRLSERGLTLWLPLGRVPSSGAGSPERPPEEAIAWLLGLRDEDTRGPWLDALPIRYVVLDGVDELASRCRTQQQLLDWFVGLLRALGGEARRPERPHVLLCASDLALESRTMLSDAIHGDRTATPPYAVRGLGALVDLVEDYSDNEPVRFTLQPWRDEDLREGLRRCVAARLTERRVPAAADVANKRVACVAPGALTSPIFFGLAYQVLSERDVELGTDWRPRDLMDRWINQLLGRELYKGAATSKEARRHAAQAIAWQLVLSGRGMEGVTLMELEGMADAWWPLRAAGQREDPLPPLAARHLTRGEFVDVTRELRNHTLLSLAPVEPAGPTRRQVERYAPFHEVLLHHLAADYIHGFGDDPAGGVLTLPKPEVVPLIDPERLPQSLEPRAMLAETLAYYWQGRGTDGASRVAAELLRSDPPRTPLTLRARDALVGQYDHVFEKLRAREEQVLSDRLGSLGPVELAVKAACRLVFLPIPAGQFDVWCDRFSAGAHEGVELRRVTLRDPVYLSRDPCTVAQFAAYLSESNEPTPAGPSHVRWRRAESGVVTFEPASAADEPVTGVSVREASSFCEWLTRRVVPDGSEASAVTMRLTNADELRVAIFGLETWAVFPPAEGPFRHRRLTSLWQHTEPSGEGDLVLGGAPDYGGDAKAIVGSWPAYSRPAPRGPEPFTGFRVAFSWAGPATPVLTWRDATT